MGTSKGSLKFQYETYSVKDRIIVVYENKNIFDSGCVGTNGLVSTTVSFSGLSSEIRVDVEPNCRGTTGTAWDFITGCPSLCAASTTKTTGQMVIHWGQTELSDNATAYITTDPEMPKIKAEYCASSTTTPSWTISFEPLSMGNMAAICPAKHFTATGYSIDITKILGNFLGGKFTVSVSASGSTQTRKFMILGKNPDASVVKAYIASKTNLWFAIPVAYYETENHGSFAQFMSNGVPVRDPLNGYGVYQITKIALCEHVWNWKLNVEEGVRRLTKFRYGLTRHEAQGWMNDQRAQAKHDNNNIAVPVPKIKEFHCVFEENTARTIEDAVAMKMYNGASNAENGNYCSWKNEERAWRFNPLNHRNENYVNRVCKFVN